MPLVKGYSGASVSRNIARERASGRDPKQAIAIAIRTARDTAKKSNAPGAKRALRRLMARR